jgi:hypothetical protein
MSTLKCPYINPATGEPCLRQWPHFFQHRGPVNAWGMTKVESVEAAEAHSDWRRRKPYFHDEVPVERKTVLVETGDYL